MTTTSKRRRTGNAFRILHRNTGRDRLREAIDVQKLNAGVAEMILSAREEAGLTQGQLAQLVGTTPSVISHLEDADYEGHSFSMLRRIAGALNTELRCDWFAPRARGCAGTVFESA